MNDRILELARQASNGFLSYDAEGEWKLNDKESEKFAELIVRECADLCDRFQARNVGMQPAEYAGSIRKMFGVE